jgi:transcriptional regulator with XRE-family HTH domain
MGFPQQLIRLREAAGLTQQELAVRSGVPRATIANLEQGRRRPTFEAAVNLAKALGVDCTALTDTDDSSGEKEPSRRPGRPNKTAPTKQALEEPQPKKPRKK